MCCGRKMKVFLEKHSPATRLWIYGAGHVAQEEASWARQVGFWVGVVDERKDWATRERFAEVDERVLKNPADHARQESGGPECFYCITTHDHPLDQAVVEALLPKPSAYIGLIGSRRKAERFKMRLLAAGINEKYLAPLRNPMGLPMHALTPPESAVSILGALIALC